MSDASYAGEGVQSRWTERSLRGWERIAAEDAAARERLARQCKKQEAIESATAHAQPGKLGGVARAKAIREGRLNPLSDRLCECGCGRRLGTQNRSGYTNVCRDRNRRFRLPKVLCRCGASIRDHSETKCSRCREGRRLPDERRAA